jgi:hypothetical protein
MRNALEVSMEAISEASMEDVTVTLVNLGPKKTKTKTKIGMRTSLADVGSV